MSYQDRTLTCCECRLSFTFSIEDQDYHAQRGYLNDPKLCPFCRVSRRDSRSSNYSFGGSGFGGGYQQREMFQAVCAQCGTQTEVPFQPRGDRPVYCRDCYSKTATGSRQRR